MGIVLLAVMALAAEPTVQSYLVALDGQDVGWAELGLERPAGGPKKGAFKFTWKADLVVSGDPCLRAHEETSGSAKLSDAALPEELFLALAGELGVGCKAIKAPGVKRGQACWTEASPEHAVGTILGLPVEVSFAPNLMPTTVRYKTLGLTYRQAAEAPENPTECHRTVADDGVLAPGSEGLKARKLAHAVYATPLAPTDVRVSTAVLPPAVKALVADLRSEDLSSCQAAAEALVSQLTAKGFPARAVAGLLLDEGRYYPHAWVDMTLGKEHVALDATTSDGAADAGRIEVGSLGDLQAGLNLLRLLHEPPKLTLHE